MFVVPIIVVFFSVFSSVGNAYATDYPFSLTTSSTNSFQFSMSATGIFYVDCGTGGTLSGTGVSGSTITRTDTTAATYTCSYSTSAANTIRFGGVATGYNTGNVATIAFYVGSNATNRAANASKVVAISGNLATIFPSLGSATSQNPKFYMTFQNCKFTTIPDTLFAGNLIGSPYLFTYSFRDCTNLTAIPDNLFAGITTGADGLFHSMFQGCTSLTSVPADLFSEVTTGGSIMFSYLFYGCSNLRGFVPRTLFAGLIANGSPYSSNMMMSMFENSGLATSCSNYSGMQQFTTGYESYWNSKVSCEYPSKFTLTTNSIAANGTFSFTMSAQGDFEVDCGEGGKLSGPGVNGDLITRSDTTESTYTCTYSTAGTKTLSFGGNVTAYNSDSSPVAAISFSASSSKVASVTGKLSDLFPILGSSANQNPKFYQTFQNCTNLTSIPDDLFSGYTGNLASAEYLFAQTFYGCTGLTSLPSHLFIGITAGGNDMFYQTFKGCTNLSGFIPKTTFYGLIANNSPYSTDMMTDIFSGTGLATSCSGYTDKQQFLTGYESYWNSKVSCESIPKFTVTTVNLSAGETFYFNLSAQGEFEVDCGAGGTLSGTGVVGSIITRSNTTDALYTCTYSSAGPKTLSFSGVATGYNSAAVTTLKFYSAPKTTGQRANAEKVAAISGDLSAVFPYSGSGVGPRFLQTFYFSSQLTTIPDTLFSGYTATSASMFNATFAYSGLTAIPENLFSHITTCAKETFNSTFAGCAGLTSIPENLFASINSYNGENLFARTFSACTGLTTIPSGLFSRLTSPGMAMFSGTFYNCTGLTSLPENLFSGITTAQQYMFSQTFQGCTNLGRYIPASMFAGLIANNHPYASNMMNNTFYNTNLATSCDSFPHTQQVTTGYESYWSSKVACQGTPYTVTYSCGAGGGTAPTTNTSAHYDSPFTPAVNSCVKEGYIFSGWEVSNTNDIKQPGTAFTWTYTENKTLTAQWTAIDYTVSFAAGISSGTMSSQTGKHIGDTITLPSSTFTAPTGYEFDKWSCDNSIGDKAAGATFSMPAANVTCTAQYKYINYTVSFAKGSGTGTMSSQIGKHIGDTITLPTSTFTAPTGYFFSGWSCDNSIGNKAVGDTFSMPAANVTCTAQWEQKKFSLTTTSLSANSTFSFTMTAKGTFVVDCGADGVLSGTGVSGNTIHRESITSEDTYTCTYSTAGAKTLKFGGIATGYYNNISGAAIKFYPSRTAVAAIDGDLSEMFPYFGSSAGQYPVFNGTFAGCSNLASIPEDLFASYTESSSYMFSQTFDNCTSLTSIPSALFSSITTAGSYTFAYTFFNCYGVTALPQTLFSGITNTAEGMFQNTFGRCSGIGGFVPPTLFAGLVANNHPYTSYMMDRVFFSDTSLATSCPNGTIQYITGYESYWDSHVSCESGSVVTYNCGTGGSGTPPTTINVQLNASFTPAANTCTRAGYTFSGWKVSSTNDTKQPGTAFTWTYTEHKTLTAQWTPIDYTVSFAAGSAGGSTPSGSTSSLTNKHVGDTITLPSSTFTAPTGYEFDKWSCDNSIGAVAAGGTFTMPAANVTCTAQWTLANYTVSFAAGSAGGSTPAGSTSSLTNKHYGDTITLPSSGFTTSSGYIFTGWSCDNSIGNKAVGATFSMPAANVTCTAQWTQEKFSLTTTSLTANDAFKFTMSAIGTFYVDCGAGGTLNGTGVSGNTITRSDTTETLYTCNYSTAGVKTVKFGGVATGYSTDTSIYAAALSFYAGENHNYNAQVANAAKVASISGNLSTIFPRLGSNQNQNPRFLHTFKSCTGLTSIPSTLFSGYTGDLTGAFRMFNGTFSGCTGLVGDNVIPASLFSGITTGAAQMFFNTFSGCTGLTAIPSGLFSNITSGGESMFALVFQGCTGLTSIPSTLFSNITTGEETLFAYAFSDCTGLTVLPENLFSGITNSAQSMFMSTFSGCTNLGGYIPKSLFAGLVANNHPTASNMWNNTFPSGVATSCPNGTVQYITGYEGNDTSSYTKWNGKVSCEPGSNITYDCGSGDGGAAPIGVAVAENASFTPAANTCTKSGYTFNGWLISGTSITKPAGTAFTWTYTGDKTLTAQWTAIDYTVSFAKGSGTGTMSSQTGKHIGDTITLPSSTFTAPTGKEFDTWSCDNSIGDKAAGATFTMPAANVTCTAQYKYINYTVSFAKGDGSGTMSSQTSKHYGDTITLPSNGFTAPTGKEFDKWNCNNSIGDKAPADTFSMPAANVTCTAQYKYINYTVSFNKGDGSGTMSSQTSKHYGDTITLPSNGFTAPTGKEFDTWSCDNSIGDKAAGATFSMPAANVTCTAQWKYINYTVSFNKGDGSGTMSSQTSKHYGDTITLPANGFTAPTGYFFTGWSCNNSIGIVAAGGTFSMPAANVTCTAQWTQQKFTLTTKSLAVNSTFTFTMSAIGTFYVDCGGGTLSGTGASGNIITRTDNTEATYTCTYTGSGAKTIKFGGTATTGYSTDTDPYVATISFYAGADDTAKAANAANVASISGDLSAIFPRFGSGAANNPKYYQTFMGCTGLTSIPEDLFSSYTGVSTAEFANTFYGCTGLTGIPGRLFSRITATNTYSFYQTFYGCKKITSIPGNLFAGITSGKTALFYQTFRGCTKITTIPDTLFSGITTGATQLFYGTFYGCTGLESLPENLFSGITAAAKTMFYRTFRGCTGLTGYIPKTMFAGLVANNSPYNTSSNGMMYQMFYSTGSLATTCPAGTIQYFTGYEDYWNSHVSCEPGSNITYDCGTGGGTAPDGIAVAENASFTPAANTCTKDGYHFDKWLIGGTSITKPAGTAFTWTYTGDKTLTAQWTANTLDLTWYAENGTTVVANSPDCTYNQTFTNLPTAPTKNGYHFTHWKVK